MVREVRWERMFPDELEAAFCACPVVYLPYGLCEPHGPQNALGLDALKAHGLCCEAARAHGGIVAPPDYWHIHELGGYAIWSHAQIGQARPWLTAVPPWMHFKNICYHIRAVDALGFHAAILLTGHYGPNWRDLKKIIELLQPHFAMRLYALPDMEMNQPGYDGSTGDHAGKVETSQLMALEPECVDLSRLPAPDATGPHFAMGADAPKADRRIGQRMVQDIVRNLGEKANTLLDDYRQHAPTDRQPLTFAHVEQIWNDVIHPHLKDFASMQLHFHKGSAPPPNDSQWARNFNVPTDV